MICCDSWGQCTRGPGCPAGSVPARTSSVATVGVSRRRSDDADAEELSNSAWAMLNANEPPGQRGNVWFDGAEPEQATPAAPQSPEPMGRFERFAFVGMVGASSAASLAIIYGVYQFFTGQA